MSESGEGNHKQGSFLSKLFGGNSEPSTSEQSGSRKTAERPNRTDSRTPQSTKDHAVGTTAWRNSSKEEEVEEHLRRNVGRRNS